MVRMSDILKRAKEKEEKAREEKSLPGSVRQEAPPRPVKPAGKVVAPKTKADKAKKPGVEEQKEEKAGIFKVRISSVVMKGTKPASDEETEKLYKETISLMKEIQQKEKIDYKSIDVELVTVQVEKIVEQLSLDNERLLGLALIKDLECGKIPLSCHSVNVCIYSIEVGLGLHYEKSRLIELGISAILHDVGMPEYRHLSKLPRKLTAREYDEVKNHPAKGLEILEKIKDLSKKALYVVHQQHERIDGSGYPRGLKGESMHEYSKIVSLVDVYEALLHERAYRGALLPLEAMQEILTNKNRFNHKLVKVLVERVGIFPIGSLVELSTKEIARVVKLNRALPMRPVVEIIHEADGKEPKETKILDLTTQPVTYIKKSLRGNELSK